MLFLGVVGGATLIIIGVLVICIWGFFIFLEVDTSVRDNVQRR
jgi:hypothetical protein